MCQAVLNAIEAAATAHNTGMNAIALLEEMVVWLQAHSHFSLSPELLVWQQKSDLYCRMQQHHTRNVVCNCDLKTFLIGARMKPVAEMNFDELVLELRKSVVCLIKHRNALRKSKEAVATVKQQAKGCRKAKLPKR
jgi:hypothetical protein